MKNWKQVAETHKQAIITATEGPDHWPTLLPVLEILHEQDAQITELLAALLYISGHADMAGSIANAAGRLKALDDIRARAAIALAEGGRR